MDVFVTQFLTLLGYHLPELLACIAGMAMLSIWTSTGPGRALAISGMAVLLGSAVLRLLLSVTQTWLIYSAQDGYESVSGMLAVFGAASMLLAVASAAGLVLLAWGASKAMRAASRDRVAAPAYPADEPS